ncbi:hypothetical protein SAMN04515674_10652 [Pseudarcicella hirudinis]|uniref:Uncharacterized protein n=1 Tax=Pseudarcicella hirudinis TaxID=1079859 RepID=A0A1I5THH4_9BACT|nr:hypothetical protein [Pseudarcicella hirudinis]SFP82475.1 hypothetical protein SAMN04515674_10652 [Pseudarcicella hirudinis]
MAKKKYFLSSNDKDAKKKILKHFDNEEHKISEDEILGGAWLDVNSSWLEVSGKDSE